MGKNTKGGKKYKRGKKGTSPIKKKIILKEDEQEYADVIKLLGDSRCDLMCYDGRKRLGIIRGKLTKRVWIKNGDLVLITKRDYQDNKCDIVHKYSDNDKLFLEEKGHLIKEKKHDDDDDDIKFSMGDIDNLGVTFDEI
ncbi:unnamed protein product [marine sediment metagenome]|uniref:S1-like domain-containing protein n=1 Tax=marine sediment metagenome TaxID=412755 RepID=X0S3H0_9ZZZZ